MKMNLKLIVPAGICIALCSALEGRLMAQDVPEAGQIGQQTKEAADDSLKLIQQELAGGGDAVTFGELLSGQAGIQASSAERRVGEQCVSTDRSRWWPDSTTKSRED